MSEIDDKINELEKRLDDLIKTQISFQKDTSQIRYEISVLRAIQQKRAALAGESIAGRGVNPSAPSGRVDLSQPSPVIGRDTVPSSPDPRPISVQQVFVQQAAPATEQRPPRRDVPPPNFGYSRAESQPKEPKPPSAFERKIAEYTESARANLEEFIGENLINKIGILILLLGIGIGVKYSIDNNLISPLTRIIMGYVFGLGLIGLAIRSKKKYHNFSAVLLSGGLATMYFVTYFGYSLYGLIGQPAAFGLMAIFTVAAVASALVYDRQVIAHIGLVGAYGVPFLLSNNSGSYAFLFTYMSIVNAGILGISIKKAWRPILYTSSAFTWLIFLGWIATKFSPNEHFYLAIGFLWVFFAIFYASNTVLGRNDDEKPDQQSLIIALVTALVFYAFCFGLGQVLTSPFQFQVLFGYVAVVSAMILATSASAITSVRDTRRPLFHIACWSTWAIYFAWFVNHSSPETDFAAALIYLGVFFALFYAARVIQGRLVAEPSREESLLAILGNAFVFYAFALAINSPDYPVERHAIVFSYVAVVTLIVLIVSLRFYGRAIVYLAYPATWLIYGVWFFNHYDPAQNFVLALVFACVNFAVFYVTTLVIRLMFDDMNVAESAGLLLTNSFVFYGFGFAIMDRRPDLQPFEGIYTVGHALLHLGVWQFARQVRATAADVGHVLVVLILTFATIAVPVQFDGNRITMIWAVEGAILFWMARTRNVKIFEYFSYPVMVLAVLGLQYDWMTTFLNRTSLPSDLNPRTFLNGDFVTAIVFLAGFGLIYAVNRNKENVAAVSAAVSRQFGYLIATMWLYVLFNTFRIEITNHFHLLMAAARAGEAGRPIINDLIELNIVWQIVYTMLFVATLNVVNLKWLRSRTLSYASFSFGFLSLLIFVVVGTVLFIDLRMSYMGTESEHAMNITIRYIGYLAAAILAYTLYECSKDELITDGTGTKAVEYMFDGLVCISMIILASGELINVMEQWHLPDSTKLGLSVLWAIFALGFVANGIRRGKKHLRIGAFVLLGVTLAKIFLYDIADLGTIPKTVLFISIGMLMLVVSFLYTKYKYVIFGQPEEEKL